MSVPIDPIGIVEAAYDLAGDDDVWLERVADRVRPSLDAGLGVIAFRYDASDPARFVWSEPAVATAGRGSREILASVNRALPPDLVMALFGRGTSLVTVSEGTGLGEALGTLPLVRELGHPHGAYDVLGLRVVDPTRRGVVFMAPLPSVRGVSPALRAPWTRIGAHLSAGLRLRRALHGAPRDGAEAVLSPDGRVVHAEGVARGADARVRLAEGVRRSERARGALRGTDPVHALEVWRGLVAGRWSLVDHVDHDGRRFVLARPNDADAPDPRALTPRERQVLGYIGLGQSLKLAGYALGLAPSTVSGHLAAAMRKLGLRNRADVARLVAALGARLS